MVFVMVAGCSSDPPERLPALDTDQLLGSKLMTVAAPAGGHGKPGAWSGSSQTEAASMRILTFGAQAQADSGATEIAGATSDSVRWTDVTCDRSSMVLEGEEVIGGYVAVVTMEVSSGKKTVTLMATSPSRSSGSVIESAGPVATVDAVSFDGPGCYDAELGQTVATAASPE
jgi:hypothetical protein